MSKINGFDIMKNRFYRLFFKTIIYFAVTKSNK